MADEEVATRAPESDAQQTGTSSPTTTTTTTTTTTATTTSATDKTPAASILRSIPHDTPAQHGPSMGEHCTTDRPLPANATAPNGEIIELNGVSCYVSKPASYPSPAGRLLLLLTGGTGLRSVNNQLQADAWAARGFVVVMPDQFAGDAAPATAATEEDFTAQEISLLERIKLGAVETAKSFLIDMWLARHTPEKVLPILHRALEGAHEAYADAVANGGGVYGVGYCFGAKYILLLCGDGSSSERAAQPAGAATAAAAAAGEQARRWSSSLTGALGLGSKRTEADGEVEGADVGGSGAGERSSGAGNESVDAAAAADEVPASGDAGATRGPRQQQQPALKVGAIAHGTLVTREDIEGVKMPVCMACVANDSLFPDEVREQGRASLELNAVEHDIRVFEGVPHGFAVLGDYANEKIKKSQADAFAMMAAWLDAHQ